MGADAATAAARLTLLRKVEVVELAVELVEGILVLLRLLVHDKGSDVGGVARPAGEVRARVGGAGDGGRGEGSGDVADVDGEDLGGVVRGEGAVELHVLLSCCEAEAGQLRRKRRQGVKERRTRVADQKEPTRQEGRQNHCQEKERE